MLAIVTAHNNTLNDGMSQAVDYLLFHPLLPAVSPGSSYYYFTRSPAREIAQPRPPEGPPTCCPAVLTAPPTAPPAHHPPALLGSEPVGHAV